MKRTLPDMNPPTQSQGVGKFAGESGIHPGKLVILQNGSLNFGKSIESIKWYESESSRDYQEDDRPPKIEGRSGGDREKLFDDQNTGSGDHHRSHFQNGAFKIGEGCKPRIKKITEFVDNPIYL